MSYRSKDGVQGIRIMLGGRGQQGADGCVRRTKCLLVSGRRAQRQGQYGAGQQETKDSEVHFHISCE
jgi:hypothetical protein